MPRCYVSLRPPAAVVEAVSARCGDDVPGLRWSDPAEYHVTLRFFPDVDIDRLIEAVATVEHRPFDVRGGPSMLEIFEGVVALPITGADPIVASIVAATAHLSPRDATFRGHLTVGRLGESASGTFAPRPCTIGWRAESVIVVESRPVGARHDHTTLAELPLRPTPP